MKLKGRCKFHWMEDESYRDNEGNIQHTQRKYEGKETYFRSDMTWAKGKNCNS